MSQDDQLRIGVRRGRALGALALAPAAQAEDFFSALFGAFGAPAAGAARLRCRLPAKATAPAPQSRCRVRAPLFRRRAGLLRAHLRRALFPDRGVRQSKPGRILQQLLPGQRDQSGLWQQYRQCRDRERQTLFRIAERVSLSHRDSSRAAPATARIRSVSRRSRSRTIRRLRKGDIVAGTNGLMVAGRGADRRGASLNFSPAPELVRSRLPARAGGRLAIARSARGFRPRGSCPGTQ